LAALAGAIPADFPGADRIAESVRGLHGDAAAVEAGLVALDDAMLERAEGRLDAAAKAELDRFVERRLDSLRERFDADELARAATRLRARELRRRTGLPLLSLFSPDAEAGIERATE
jgi:hypothetical protein